MAKERNLKVGITTDASGFKRGLDDSKTAVRDFERAGSKALSALDNALGGALSTTRNMSSAFKGAVIEIGKLGSAGKSAGSVVNAAMASAAAGIAGLGIGAAIIAFKALNAEADAFRATVQGASIQLATDAYISTYKQAMHDINESTGRSVAEAQSRWQKFWGTLGTNIMQGVKTGALIPGQGLANVANILEWRKQMSSANEAAATAAQLTSERYDLERQLANLQVQIAKWDAQIADYRYKANLETYTAVEKSGFLAAAAELINQKYEAQIALQEQITAKTVEIANQASNTVEAEDAMLQSQVQLISLTQQRAQELRELTERQNTLNADAAKELAITQQIAATRASMASGAISSIQGPNMTGALAGLVQSTEAPITLTPKFNLTALQEFISGLKTGTVKGIGEASIVVGIEADASDVVDITQQLNSLINMSVISMSESIGQLVGDLATGADAWGNFGSNVLGTLGDLAISVGRMAVQTGITVSGIKAALETLNPYVAIAAGAALIALGAGIKSGLSNAASGTYSAATNVASASPYNTSTTDMYQRDMTVKVTGTLQASGSTLVAVLNNEGERINRTT